MERVAMKFAITIAAPSLDLWCTEMHTKRIKTLYNRRCA